MSEEGYLNGNAPMLEKIIAVHGIVEDIQSLLGTVVTAQQSMAVSASTMAATNSLAERRYATLDARLEKCHERAAGKGMMPIVSHLLILITTVIITLLTITYVTNQTIKGTLTSLEVTQHAKEVK